MLPNPSSKKDKKKEPQFKKQEPQLLPNQLEAKSDAQLPAPAPSPSGVTTAVYPPDPSQQEHGNVALMQRMDECRRQLKQAYTQQEVLAEQAEQKFRIEQIRNGERFLPLLIPRSKDFLSPLMDISEPSFHPELDKEFSDCRYDTESCRMLCHFDDLIYDSNTGHSVFGGYDPFKEQHYINLFLEQLHKVEEDANSNMNAAFLLARFYQEGRSTSAWRDYLPADKYLAYCYLKIALILKDENILSEGKVKSKSEEEDVFVIFSKYLNEIKDFSEDYSFVAKFLARLYKKNLISRFSNTKLLSADVNLARFYEALASIMDSKDAIMSIERDKFQDEGQYKTEEQKLIGIFLKAVEALKPFAELYAPAAMLLGDFYREGRESRFTKEKYLPVDRSLAKYYFRLAAINGNATGLYWYARYLAEDAKAAQRVAAKGATGESKMTSDEISCMKKQALADERLALILMNVAARTKDDAAAKAEVEAWRYHEKLTPEKSDEAYKQLEKYANGGNVFALRKFMLICQSRGEIQEAIRCYEQFIKRFSHLEKAAQKEARDVYKRLILPRAKNAEAKVDDDDRLKQGLDALFSSVVEVRKAIALSAQSKNPIQISWGSVCRALDAIYNLLSKDEELPPCPRQLLGLILQLEELLKEFKLEQIAKDKELQMRITKLLSIIEIKCKSQGQDEYLARVQKLIQNFRDKGLWPLEYLISSFGDATQQLCRLQNMREIADKSRQFFGKSSQQWQQYVEKHVILMEKNLKDWLSVMEKFELSARQFKHLFKQLAKMQEFLAHGRIPGKFLKDISKLALKLLQHSKITDYTKQGEDEKGGMSVSDMKCMRTELERLLREFQGIQQAQEAPSFPKPSAPLLPNCAEFLPACYTSSSSGASSLTSSSTLFARQGKGASSCASSSSSSSASPFFKSLSSGSTSSYAGSRGSSSSSNSILQQHEGEVFPASVPR